MKLVEEEKIREYKTKTNGHPISLYYTIIVYSAVIFLFFPEFFYKMGIGWLYALGSIGIAIVIALVPRLFGKMRITRVYISDSFLQITAKVIQIEDITRISHVKRSSLFGDEIQVYTHSSLMLSGIIAFKELEKPDELMEDLEQSLSNVVFVKEYASYHIVDWGLLISIIALGVLITWKVFL